MTTAELKKKILYKRFHGKFPDVYFLDGPPGGHYFQIRWKKNQDDRIFPFLISEIPKFDSKRVFCSQFGDCYFYFMYYEDL